MKYILIKISHCTNIDCSLHNIVVGNRDIDTYTDINAAYKIAAKWNKYHWRCRCKWEVKEIE